MEEQRPPKRLCTMALNQGGCPREPGAEGAGRVGAADPWETDQPSKSFAKPRAYVKPMRMRTSAFHLSGRGQSHPEGRGQQLERGHRRETGRLAELSLQAGPGHWPGPDVELDRPQAEPGRPGGPFPSTEATTARGDAGPGSEARTTRPRYRVAVAQLRQGLQGAPGAASYWTPMGSPAVAVYPSTQYSPLAGTAWFLTHTSSGPYVYGVPVFFAHIAR